MAHFSFLDVNEAFMRLVSTFANHSEASSLIEQESRNGPVVRSVNPMVITYREAARRKVLFNQARDCNPFFHVFEAMWMLAGRNELAPLLSYVSTFGQFSDDGETLHGAYGYRWREWFGYDQLNMIIEELKENPDSRRCVLQMWDASALEQGYSKELENGLVTGRHDLYTATNGGKDVPCNLSAVFNVINNELVMTVFNRSNDLILGCLGANYVHFGFLQEYVANCLGLPCGPYHQVTTNLHVYVDSPTWKPESYLRDETEIVVDFSEYRRSRFEKECFDREVQLFVDDPVRSHTYRDTFLNDVAKPMMKAFYCHKERLYDWANTHVEEIKAGDWRMASRMWLEKRRLNWEAKNVKAPIAASDPTE